MTGYPQFNFPAFNAAAERLRAEGHTVFNPAETDGGDTSKSWEYYMRKDIAMLTECDAIAALPGWWNSKGAQMEIEIAQKLSMPILNYETLGSLPVFPRIALTGYARVGKDEIGRILVGRGYTRAAFGDIIKRQLDPLINQYFKFSAFTEVDAEKRQIRRTLESWGEDNYDLIFKEYFEALPDKVVNTRLVRAREAQEWVKRGGVILKVERAGFGPETPFAERMSREIEETGLIRGTIHNCGRLSDLEKHLDACLSLI